MALFTLPGITIKGIATAVPAQVEDNLQCAVLPEKERELFIKTVGIRYRRVAPKSVTASDLCLAAAEKLLNEINWPRNEIQALVFISQTPDYVIPNTASVLQQKLGLAKNCLVFDVNLGCSGYVYGLSIIGSILRNIPGGKGLLLVGDVSTHTISGNDKSTTPLFSDAGSATALQVSGAGAMYFNLQTDGSEYDDIMVPDGGFRNRVNAASFDVKEYDKGVYRTNLDMKLDGLKIFNFALREIAPNIELLLAENKFEKEAIDYFVFHQANLLMLESVRKKLKVDSAKVPYTFYNYGNTSSATIPVTIVTQLGERLAKGPVKLLLSGFGVGLSWGSVYIETDNIHCVEMIEL